MAGDLVIARAAADRALRIAGDSSAIVYGGIQRELVRLCTLEGDLVAALRHADGDSFALEGRLPRMVEPSAIIHGASVALLQGNVVDAALRAERALTAIGWHPCRGESCGAPGGSPWSVPCAEISRGRDRSSPRRAASSRWRAISASPPSFTSRECNSRCARRVRCRRRSIFVSSGWRVRHRLLLPLLLARLAVLNGDAGTVESALAELDRLEGSRWRPRWRSGVRALMLVPTRRRREATDALDDSASTLERLRVCRFRGRDQAGVG